MRPCLARRPCVLTFDLAAADKGTERKLPAGTGTAPSVYMEDSVSPCKLLNCKLG